MGASESSLDSVLQKSSLDELKLALTKPGVDVNGSYTNPVLYSAVWYNNVDAVRLILQQPNVDVNRDGGPPLFRQSPLFVAVHNGNLEITKLLLAHPDIDVNKGYYSTPLLHAIERNQNQIVAALLQHPKVDPNHGLSARPIEKALALGNLEAVLYLVQHSKTNLQKLSANLLTFTLQQYSTELMRVLAPHSQINLNQKFPHPTNSSTTTSVSFLYLLLIHIQNEMHCVEGRQLGGGGYWAPDMMGSNKNYFNTNIDAQCLQSLPEQWEMTSKDTSKPNSSTDARASGNDSSKQNDTLPAPLTSEEKIGRITEILRLVLAQPSLDPNQGNETQTPLHFACQMGLTEIARLLLSNKNTNEAAMDSEGHTAEQIASLWGHVDVTRVFEDRTSLVSMAFVQAAEKQPYHAVGSLGS